MKAIFDSFNRLIRLVLNKASELHNDSFVAGGTIKDALENLAPRLAGEPNGFVDRTKVSLSWDNATRSLTVTPVGGYQYFADGMLFTETVVKTLQISNVTGMHWVCFDASGSLVDVAAFESAILNRYALVASIYWDAVGAAAVPDALLELHGCEMPADTHLYLHNTHATAFQSGLLPAVTAVGDGSLLSDVQVAAASGVIHDEDLMHTLGARSAIEILPVCYRVGDSWKVDASSSAMVRTAGSGRAAYNLNTAGVWSLAEAGNNSYVAAHLYAIPGITQKYMIVMGTAAYGNAPAARAATRAEVLGITGLPVAEAKLVATFLLQTSDAYTNSVKSRRVDTGTNEQFIDWRYVAIVAGIPSAVPPVP